MGGDRSAVFQEVGKSGGDTEALCALAGTKRPTLQCMGQSRKDRIPDYTVTAVLKKQEREEGREVAEHVNMFTSAAPIMLLTNQRGCLS